MKPGPSGEGGGGGHAKIYGVLIYEDARPFKGKWHHARSKHSSSFFAEVGHKMDNCKTDVWRTDRA